MIIGTSHAHFCPEVDTLQSCSVLKIIFDLFLGRNIPHTRKVLVVNCFVNFQYELCKFRTYIL